MAKLSTLIAALAVLAFTAPAAFAGCAQHTAQVDQGQTAQGQASVQTAEQPQQTTKPETKTESAAQ